MAPVHLLLPQFRTDSSALVYLQRYVQYLFNYVQYTVGAVDNWQQERMRIVRRKETTDSCYVRTTPNIEVVFVVEF